MTSKQRQNRYERTTKGRFKSLRTTAKRRGIPVTLTVEEHAKLLSQPCHYCNHPLTPTGGGVDRKSHLEGYSLTNVVSCCGGCNKLKGILTYEEMLLIVAFRRLHNIPPFTN